jgi:hypothetical protein
MYIDFLIRNISNEINNIEKVIKDIINQENENNFISFQLREVIPIAEHRVYGASLIRY